MGISPLWWMFLVILSFCRKCNLTCRLWRLFKATKWCLKNRKLGWIFCLSWFIVTFSFSVLYAYVLQGQQLSVYLKMDWKFGELQSLGRWRGMRGRDIGNNSAIFDFSDGFLAFWFPRRSLSFTYTVHVHKTEGDGGLCFDDILLDGKWTGKCFMHYLASTVCGVSSIVPIPFTF